jgi:hypothetical protein
MPVIALQETRYPELGVAVKHHHRRNLTLGGYDQAPDIDELAAAHGARRGYRLPAGIKVDLFPLSAAGGERFLGPDEVARALVRHFCGPGAWS